VKRILGIIAFSLCLYSVNAQIYGNSWIRYSQKYYKFPIAKEGVYRIDSTALAAYFNLSTTNPKNFQLFIGGAEQDLYIRGESDNLINKKDYLEFYANTNAIRILDSLLHKGITYLPAPYSGTFNDTIYAFLTLNNSVNNKRYVEETDTTAGSASIEDHFVTERNMFNKSGYTYVDEFPNSFADPNYTQNEGWGTFFTKGGVMIHPFTPLNPYTLTPVTCTWNARSSHQILVY
jgi:hypothetical protein